MVYRADLFFVLPALRITGHVVLHSEDKDTLMQLHGQGLFVKLRFLLSHKKGVVRRESCWALSNVAASCQEIVEKIYEDYYLIEKILHLFKTDHE